MDGGDTEPAALEATHLGKRYRRDRAWALRDINLMVSEGSVVALVGPNGAGKTTLIRCFMGFEAADEGSVRVAGIDPKKDKASALQRVGYVGQEAALYRDLTVTDHISMAGALRRGFDGASARRRLDELAVPLRAKAGELSGGQRAQVALAIALATHAQILLLDEPVASLDPFARQSFLTVLKDAVRADGATVILSSHIVGDLAQVCDSLAILAPGRVALHEPIAEARDHHRLVDAGSETNAVATFTRPDGTQVSLVRVVEGGDVGLDDLVYGYLAAATPVGAAA